MLPSMSYSLTSTPILRDGVEVFIFPPENGHSRVLFLFLGSRRRLTIECKYEFTNLLRSLAHKQTLGKSLSDANLKLDALICKFLHFLQDEGIILFDDPLLSDILPSDYIERYKRQIYFLLDMLKGSNDTLKIQRNIFDANITIFGLGAVGSNVLLQLCMMGFRKFTLIDYNILEENDIARTPYPIYNLAGSSKVIAAKQLIDDFSYDPIINTYQVALNTKIKLDPLLKDSSIIINSADEPYIGYTNIRLSRYGLKHNIPVLACGGFDAHLASLGEILIPNITPCADCYAAYFHEKLKNWKPIPHPIRERGGWYGGLGSLSVFSAASAALKVFLYFTKINEENLFAGGRGEFLFDDYSLDTFTVERDPCCLYCGDKHDSTPYK